MSDFSNVLRIKKPCSNCPFRKHGGIELADGRLESIIDSLSDDMNTFQCHKTVHSSHGGSWDDEGNYISSGNEAMCAGAAAYLMNIGRPTVLMRMSFALGMSKPSDWDEAKEMIIQPISSEKTK